MSEPTRIAVSDKTGPEPRRVPATSFISVGNVTRRFDQGQRVALDGLSLDIPAGEFTAVMGPSGCGKSTLLHLMGGLDRPDGGSVTVDGVEVSALREPELAKFRRSRIGHVFQFFHLLPTMTARANVALPALLAGVGRREASARALELLERLGIAGRRDELATRLSGGEQQRVAIARALVNEPVLLLADEPTGSLDSASAAVVIDVLRGLNAAGLTIVMVTHDAGLATSAQRIVRLRDGAIADDMLLADPIDAVASDNVRVSRSGRVKR